MAQAITLTVIAIGASKYSPALTRAVNVDNISNVNNPRKAADNSWIGSGGKPSNWNDIYSEIEVSEDMSSDRVFYYTASSVATIVSAMNA